MSITRNTLKFLKKQTAILLICGLGCQTLFADDVTEDATAKYLKTLGDYLGYDLTAQSALFSDTLFDYTLNVVANTSTGQNILSAMLSAIPMNAAFPTFFTDTSYDALNQAANKPFSGFAAQTDNDSSITATEQFDQAQWQRDPVSQAILNMVGTPDLNTCPTNSENASSKPCLSNYQTMLTVLSGTLNKDGELPGEYEYMDYNNTSQFISQLNSNNLIGPMIYASNGGNQKGFPSQSQIQQAQAFVRYATEGVLPIPTMSPTDYSTLRKLAYPDQISENLDIENMNNAKVALANYLLNLRVYAAKSSVAISNLYYILGKRVKQSVPGSNDASANSSQAMNEFRMATWRLYNPETKQSSDQWAQKINNSAPSAVQKEMAILLSEINYQLYLNRQQQERLLLTDSMILMQLLSLAKPSSDFPSSVDKDPNKDLGSSSGAE